MANKDWNWKYRDVQPEQPIPLTAKQKVRNWWDYHKWHLVITAVLLAIIVDLGKSVIGVGKMEPDYQFAYVGSSALPDDTVAALQTELAALGEDCNGDGSVTVRINQYVLSDRVDQDAAYAYASEVTLIGDLEACDSYFFILENDETFQADYHVLADRDGMLAEESAGSVCSFRWRDCPVLAGLELGEYTQIILGQEITGGSQDLMQNLRIARRGFREWKGCTNPEQYRALWNTITGGAAA